MDVANLIISIISGIVGGNVAGKAVSENKDLGPIANSLIGLVGGAGGDFLLKALGVLGTAAASGATGTAATGSELDIGAILANIGVSGVSGGVLTAIISLIKDAIQKK